MLTSISVHNKTDYFDPLRSRLKNSFHRPDTHFAQQLKRSSYEQRLWYETKDVIKHGGQVFFYTLTYNDVALPHYYGVPCFDYNDIRELTNGAFKKYLLRNYNLSLTYFVSCESGEGAGKRGIGKNPHYHCMFFLRPRGSSYKKIDAFEFRRIIRRYWQGSDFVNISKSDINRYNKNKLKYGIVEEGENLGEVTDYRACNYCAKYVVKDLGSISTDKLVYKVLSEQLSHSYSVNLEDFVFDCFQYDSNNIESVNKLSYYCSLCPIFQNRDDLKDFDPYSFFELLSPDDKNSFYEWYKFAHSVEFNNWKLNMLKTEIDDLYKDYKNHHSAKVRISNGIGSSTVDYVIEKHNRLFLQMPDKSGFRDVPISNFTYRKLFYDYHIDFNTGNVYYQLNDKGVKWKKKTIVNDIESSSKKLMDSIGKFTSKTYYNEMYEFYSKRNLVSVDVDYPSLLQYESFIKKYKQFRSCKLIYDYIIYKKLYEDRLYFDHPYKNHVYFIDIDFDADYSMFLQNSHDTVNYCPNSRLYVSDFYDNGYMPYSMHPYFRKYISLFICFDFLRDYETYLIDIRNKESFEERVRLRKFHKLNNK